MRLKSMGSLSLAKQREYIKTEDVFAVPLPPVSIVALLQKLDLGWLSVKFSSISARKESGVGIKS